VDYYKKQTMTVTLTEKIDIKKLKCLVNNIDELKDMIGVCRDMNTYKKTDYDGTKTILKSYLASKDSNGSSDITYDFSRKNKDGRLFSKTHSLQGLPRVVRHTISSENMIDVDIKNCHPEIFRWYCKNNDIACDNLCYYIENRDNCLSDLMKAFPEMSKDDAKCSVLSIINGGMGELESEDKTPDWYHNLGCEIQTAHDIIASKHPHYEKAVIESKGDKAFNIPGKVTNKVFCYYEGIILNHMSDFAKSAGFNIGALCFDGLMLYKNSNIDLQQFLIDMEKYIHSKVGLDLKIVEKEMTEGIDLSRFNIPEDEPVDTYIWTDFLYDARKVFDSLSDLMDFFKANFPRVCKKINIGTGFYLKKEHMGLLHNNTTVKELDKSVKFYYLVTNTNANGKESEKQIIITLGDLFEKCHLTIYSHVVCHPKNNNSRALNTWIPLKADKMRYPTLSKVQPLLDFIRDIICDGNQEMYKYFLTWIRQICLTPENKTGKVIVFQSRPGSGKGSLVDWMTKHIFGESCATNMKLEALTSKFNSKLMNKVFISVDELPITSERFHAVFDTLKNQITAHVMEIQYKGKEPFDTDNLLNLLFMTNHENSIKLESGDRRYVVYKINESRVGDFDFWTMAHNEIFTEDMAIEFFNYLRYMNTDDLVNLNVIPSSELRTKMIENSLNSIQMFIKLVRSREINCSLMLLSGDDTPLKDIPISEQIKINKDNLYTPYCNWCVKVGEKTLKQKKFNEYLTEKKDTIHGRFWVV